MIPLAPLLSSFLCQHLPVDRGASPATIATYTDCYRLFVSWAASRLKVAPSELSFEQLDADMVLAFLSHLETARGNSARSRNVRLAAIRTLMAYAADHQPSLLDQTRRIRAIPIKKTDRRLITALDLEQTLALLDTPAHTSRSGVRDRAILILAVNTGLRASELVNATLQNLDLGANPELRVMGKGRKERALSLWKETVDALQAWLAIRGSPRAPTLFVNARGGAMTRWGLAYVLRKHAHSAERCCPSLVGKRVTPHVLRHTCALILLDATRNLCKVSLWLGHESITTTEVYTRASPSERISTAAAFVPPSLRRGRFSPPDRLLALLQPPRPPTDYVESQPPS
jgi:integrase/recombinase XerD